MPTDDAVVPFRIVLIAELLPRPEFALTHTAPTTPVPITRETFDEVMQRFSPSLALDLPNNPKPIEVTFSRLGAFRPEWLVKNVPALKVEPAPARAPAPAPAPGPKSLLDQLLDDMGDDTAPSTPRAPPARVETRVANVLTHPEVRRLEAAWRGVKFVTDAFPRGAPVVLEVLHATPDTVTEAFELLQALPPTGTPIGLVVVDAVMGATARDCDRLIAWARGGEALRAPVVTNGTSELLGFDTLEALGTSSRGLAHSDDPRAALFRTVAADDASRWLVVAVNGLLARPRHSESTAREGVAVLEPKDLFFGAAYGVAALVAASVHRTGAPFTHSGSTHGVLSNLPVRVTKVGGTERALSLEAGARADSAEEAAKAGVAMFAAVQNRDAAILPVAPVVFRGPSTASGTSRPASLTLGDQLFTAAAVSAVFGIAQAIPPDTDAVAAREAAQVMLAAHLTFNGERASCEVSIGASPPSLNVTVRPGRVAGVSVRDISFAAPLGESA